MGRYGVERMDLAEATEGHYPTHMGRDKNTEKRSISVRKGRWQEWGAEAARLTGALGRPFSISELIDNAVAQAIASYGRGDAGQTKRPKDARAARAGSGADMVATFSARAPSGGSERHAESVQEGLGAGDTARVPEAGKVDDEPQARTDADMAPRKRHGAGRVREAKERPPASHRPDESTPSRKVVPHGDQADVGLAANRDDLGPGL